MMRKLFNIQAILSLAFMFALFSCEYEQEVEAPISTDGYSIAIYETDFSGTSVTEGDMISYTVTIDKPLDVDLTFTVMLLDGAASEDALEVEAAEDRMRGPDRDDRCLVSVLRTAGDPRPGSRRPL